MAEFEEICRVCLDTNAQDLHQIFEESLSNKIIIITGLDVRFYYKFTKYSLNSLN